MLEMSAQVGKKNILVLSSHRLCLLLGVMCAFIMHSTDVQGTYSPSVSQEPGGLGSLGLLTTSSFSLPEYFSMTRNYIVLEAGQVFIYIS